MSLQQDVGTEADALAEFVAIENKKHGIEVEAVTLDIDTQQDDKDEKPQDLEADGKPDTGETQQDPPDEKLTEGDGSQTDTKEDGGPQGDEELTREQLVEQLAASETENAKLKHSDQSNKGRVKALTRQSTAYRNQLSALGTSRGPSKETAQRQLSVAEAELEALQTEMGKDYPDTLKLVEKTLQVNNLKTAAVIDEKIDPIRKSAEVLLSETVQSGAEEANDIMLGKYNVSKMIASSEFTEWLDVLPPTYRELFDTSEDPTVQMQILDSFALGRDVSEFEVGSSEPEPDPKPENLPPSQDAEKKQQQEDAGGLDGKSNALPDVTKGDSDSAEASFDNVERDKEQKRTGKITRVEI